MAGPKNRAPLFNLLAILSSRSSKGLLGSPSEKKVKIGAT